MGTRTDHCGISQWTDDETPCNTMDNVGHKCICINQRCPKRNTINVGDKRPLTLSKSVGVNILLMISLSLDITGVTTIMKETRQPKPDVFWDLRASYIYIHIYIYIYIYI